MLTKSKDGQRQGQNAMKCIECLRSEGLSPNEITFVCILSACGHSGLLSEAEMLFRSMMITPSLEHNACMVTTFGHAGYFEKAISLIKRVSYSDYTIVWFALLNGCRKWGNMRLGKLAFDEVVKLDNTCAGAYVLMADIFIAVGMQEDAQRIETMRLKYANQKSKKIVHGHDSSMWGHQTF